MRIEPELSEVEVIVLGAFDPALFEPAWFVRHGLLPEPAADGAEIALIPPPVMEFTFEWLLLQASAEHFSAGTSQAPHVRVCDLVVRVFGECLPDTPLRAFEINRYVHFPVWSPDDRDRIGRMLAPVEPWGGCGLNLGRDGEHGGMTSLTMSQLDPPGRAPGGRINVRVEPSNRIGDPRAGIYVCVNDHYPIDEASPTTGRSTGILEENFEASLERSDGIIDHVMSLAKEQET